MVGDGDKTEEKKSIYVSRFLTSTPSPHLAFRHLLRCRGQEAVTGSFSCDKELEQLSERPTHTYANGPSADTV